MTALVEEEPKVETPPIDETLTGGPLIEPDEEPLDEEDDAVDEDEDDDEDLEVEDNSVPVDPEAPAKPKRKGGRPKGSTKAALAARRAPKPEPKTEVKKTEEPARKPRNPTKKFWNFIGKGSWVLWYDMGTRQAEAYVAQVMRKHEPTLSVDLRIYRPEDGTRSMDGRVAHRYEMGVRHIDDPEHNEHQMKECGAWEMTRESQTLFDLVMNAD